MYFCYVLINQTITHQSLTVWIIQCSLSFTSLQLLYSSAGVQKLILSGKVSEAINVTQELYPGLLEGKPNLLFMLKCRQFVEMVNGTDSELYSKRSPHPISAKSSPCMSPNSYQWVLFKYYNLYCIQCPRCGMEQTSIYFLLIEFDCIDPPQSDL